MRPGASSLCALFLCSACSSATPAVPIVFSEVADDRVPMIAQSDFIEPNKFFGPGAAVGDVDGDGRPDLFVGGVGGGLFLNRADPGGFRFEPAPLPPIAFAPIGTAFGDFDRDGDLDLAVCGLGGVRLLANDGAGNFTDVTATAGVAGPPTDLCVSVTFGDLDGDGWPELVAGSYGIVFDATYDQQASHVWVNRRDGTFTDLPSLAQPDDVRRALVTAIGDFDGDGRPDLFLSDDAEVSFLDRAKPRHDLVLAAQGLDPSGAPALADTSAALGLADERSSMSCLFGDGGGGWQLFFADVDKGWLMWSSAPGKPFADVADARGVKLGGPVGEEWIMWGGGFADLDGDGREDLLVGQAPIHPDMADTSTLGPLLLRAGAGGYALTRYAFGGPMRARAILLVDLDGDGDQDAIVVPYFNRFRFFRNDTAPRRFVRVTLVPTVSAPGAAGAVLTLKAGGATQRRMHAAGGQPHSQGEAVVDFGGAARGELTVTWPSGAVQAAGTVAGAVVVTEPAWLALSSATPPADGATAVTVTVDAAAAGLGGAGSHVHWDDGTSALDATCDGSGVATLELPPRSAPAGVRGTLTIDGRAVPATPALDYR